MAVFWLVVNGPYNYGIYQWALPVISSNFVALKILYPIFWGLMTLSCRNWKRSACTSVIKFIRF
ncbi:hypothetical protein CIPAW_15G119300 [Carya illinoinensis]|uniref:Uncharacterized protein n=1 Tax=Carya illinoinensis TaxID=32201 RepID=A0A8T1N6K1_CARIL|nr:hypothetical protein CIPAW_15G119300 [Carya illinoinensis]